MWILQNNIWKEEKYYQLIELLSRYSIDYKVITMIPFSESIELPCEPSEVEMVFGSIRFVELAKKQGVKVHFNDNFDFQVWSKIFGENCLNYDSTILKISDVQFPLQYDVFIRPVLDDKSFSGTVLRAGDTLKSIQFTTSKEIDSILVQVAPIKKIYGEFRYFVVGGKIITGSTYKVGSTVRYVNVDNLDLKKTEIVKDMINIWRPSDMFVIDVADTDDGVKIVEFGSIHNCGFYDIDLSKLVQAIELYDRIY